MGAPGFRTSNGKTGKIPGKQGQTDYCKKNPGQKIRKKKGDKHLSSYSVLDTV